ncbi:MAG: fumarylacetoacetate hydrolase family protein, partial [Chloroflexi bacterium]|nr:fumarylacetoacetate hydrolase family protein [Chloroflexota bacterium]MCI0874894.1 fumarylacetoacetate hydrolase family protein [Chloroflexota bacterium]
MNEEAIKQSAGILALTRVRNRKIDGLPDEYRPADQAEAYQVQEQLHSLLNESGFGKRVGYKIGCTTPVMQNFLGIANPCAGGVFNTSTNYVATTVDFAKYSHPGVECEIAAFIGADLVPDDRGFTRESVAPAVKALFGAIEIVDDRWTDYKTVDTPSLIADDFFASGIVLSQPTPAKDAPDLANAVGHMTINGQRVGQGTTGDILGHPFEALAWLANSLAARGKHLVEGEIVMLGSVVETRWVTPGDEVAIDIEGVGGALVKFE